MTRKLPAKLPMARKIFLSPLLALMLAGGCATTDSIPDDSRSADGKSREATTETGSSNQDRSDSSTAALTGSSKTALAGRVPASREDEAPAADAQPAPELINRLPEALGSFDYAGYRYFTQSEAGFSVRYQNPRKKRSADVYVYPVARENLSLEHSQLVMGSTRASLQAIGKAVSQGLYANFTVLGAATQALGTRTVARVKTTYLQDNLASYSLLYQTEFKGTLVKIRINMPDNEYNRSSTEWDQFALRIFDLVIAEERSERHAAASGV